MDPWGRPYGGIKPNGHPCLLVKSPCDYTHMRTLRFFLRIVSGWPGKELGEKLLFCEGKYHGIYNTTLSIVFFTMMSWYLVENATKLSFLELGHMYVALLMNVLSTTRAVTLCLLPQYKALAVRFLTQTHVFYHKDKSDYSRKVYAQVHKITNYFCAYQIVITLIAQSVFNIVPAYMNYTKGNFESVQTDPMNTTLALSIYFKLPMDPEHSLKAYIYSFVLNWYASYLCATSVIMFDLFLSIMIFNLWGHFKILLHSLDNFPKPAILNDKSISYFNKQSAMYSPVEQEEIAANLKESIIYHRSIIDFTNEMSSCFGLVLFIYYMFHQVSGCLLLLECCQGPDALARYLPLTLMMTAQLIQISIIFETIGSMSEKVKDEVYCLPWEYMNTRNRTTVTLFLINVQEPVHVKAGGLVDVGVTTMAGILKASFSYFAFLRNMQ